MTGKLSVVVSVDEARLKDFPAVLRDMVEAGLHVENQMAMVGTVSGSIDDARTLNRLRRVKGVAHVERCRHFQIAPPNADVQ
ncbi:hypothetical protein [Geminicoccus roseus]|uniref:hypothetical protein n=1 Tax=Geminicoccus roseus TaxID=404900 RepID=UPI00041AB75C|nr:hypothetical protein [Geminicoccus roseus]